VKKILWITLLSLFVVGCGQNMHAVQMQNSNAIILTNDPWTGFSGNTEYSIKLHENMASNHCAKFGKFAFQFANSYKGSRTEGVEFLCLKDYQDQNFGHKLLWTNYKNNQQASGDLTSTINSKKQKCIEMGFKEETEKLADCVLRLVEIEEAKQNNQMQKQRNAEAGLAAALDSIVKSTNKNTNRSTTCFKAGEEVGGFNKICRYRCVGNLVTTTIGSMQLCPLTIQR
jgi:hypothetical protein